MSIYVKDKWFGGISEDDVLGGPNRYLYSENIDIYSNTNYVQLSKKAYKSCYTGSNIYNIIDVKDPISNSKALIVFCENEIYKYNSDTPVYTDSTLNKLEYPVFKLDGYLYFVHNTGPTSAFSLNRTTLADAVGSSWAPTIGYATLATNNYFQYSCVVTFGAFAYIGLGNKISRFNSTDGSVDEFSLIGEGEEIVGITYISSSYFKIYTNGGKRYIWDGNSDAVTDGIDLGIYIERVKQVANRDYLITGGGQAGLYTTSGDTLTPIFNKRETELINEYKFNFYRGVNNSCITNYRDSLFFIEENIDGLTYKVSKFGKDIQGLPNAFSYILNKSDLGNELYYTNCLYNYFGTIYVSFYDGVNRGLLRFGGRTDEGYIITNISDMGNGILKKKLNGIYVRVADITSTQYIEIYKSINGGSFELIHTINEQPLDDLARIPQTGDFRDISLKFVLKSSTTTSPKLYYGPYIEYEQVKNY